MQRQRLLPTTITALFKSRMCIFFFIVALILLASHSTSAADSKKRVVRTLRLNQSLSIYSYKCTLSVQSRTSDKVVVRCSKQIRNRFQKRPIKRSYLAAKQVAAIKAKACSLQVAKDTPKQITIRCLAPVSATPVTATPVPTSSPPVIPSATAIPTATPVATPTATSIPSPTAIPAFEVGGTVSGLSGTVVLQNNGSDNSSISSNGSFSFPTTITTGGAYNVTVLTQPAAQTCLVSNGSGNMGSSTVTNVSVTCTSNTTLSVSSSALALSITGITEFGVSGSPASGLARVITLTNTGSFTTTNLEIDFPTFPSGTSAITTCGSSLAAASSCTITVTPGNTATSDGTNPCTDGTAPTPGNISISADNSNTVSTDIVVLGYHCLFQGGYVYFLDDSTSASSSVGGKVVTTSDQAAPFPSGIIWSSNGNGGDVSFDTIPFIDETSSASYSQAQTDFNGDYANTGTFPFPSSSEFASCSGGTDGACNTNNIAALYDAYITNYDVNSSPPYTLSAGPTNLNVYAAGLCRQTINGFSDWYLPAICEMGPNSNGSGCAANQSMVNTLPALLGAPSVGSPSTNCTIGTGCLAGYYWSSTTLSSDPQSFAWGQFFDSVFPSEQDNSFKSVLLGVRCSRNLS